MVFEFYGSSFLAYSLFRVCYISVPNLVQISQTSSGMTRRASHPQYTMGILGSRIEDKGPGSQVGGVMTLWGCANRHGTSSEPLVPELVG